MRALLVAALGVSPRAAWRAAPASAGRRQTTAFAVTLATSLVVQPDSARSLVKGSSPPAKGAKRERPTCSSVDECRSLGEAREAELFESVNEADIQRTPSGDRFIDLTLGTGKTVAVGDVAQLRFRVLRLGKRSRDGLSGEASTIFSVGFGEDGDAEGDTVPVAIGSSRTVAALDEGLRGMRVGGRRRINVRPERGWKLPNEVCLETFTDVTIVPTSKVQANDSCFNAEVLPTPANFGAKRRMLRRYDETLIVDCELMGIGDAA